MKSWSLKPRTTELLLEQLLLNRGITDPEKQEQFLHPKYLRDLHDPYLMKGMREAVERIFAAFAAGEKIVIFGDYDADGVPATAILAQVFKKFSYTNFDIYIPDRHEESYGLSLEAIQSIHADGAKLIVTVDCGITDVEEVALANELGIDVIITDHHLVPEVLPPAYTIVNPKQLGETYPFDMLCGAGVAFKLAQAIIREWDAKGYGEVVGSNWEKLLLDLAGIATVSDMVPLVDENRALAYFGLAMLRRTNRPGLTALFGLAALKQPAITEDDIGFTIGPRINSASRMSHASEAYKLLTTSDVVEAQTIAKHLEAKNKERKKTVEKIIGQIDSQIGGKKEQPPVLVVGDPTWSLGVLGLAASRLGEKYNAPVFVWSKNGKGEVKGSCRSNGSVNVVELMRATNSDNFFVDLGGHAMAGGFTLAVGKESELEARLISAYEKVAKEEVVEEIMIDAELGIDEVKEETYRVIEQLAPYGMGNPKPVFLFRNVPIITARGFGNGGIHLELSFKKTNGQPVNAIGFFSCTPDERGEFDATHGHRFHGVILESGSRVNLLANFEKSFFKYKPDLRLRIVDIQPA